MKKLQKIKIAEEKIEASDVDELKNYKPNKPAATALDLIFLELISAEIDSTRETLANRYLKKTLRIQYERVLLGKIQLLLDFILRRQSGYA